MKKHIPFLLGVSLLLSFLCTVVARGNNNLYNQVVISTLSPLTTECRQGVSGAFSGMIGGDPVVAGGCNFPNLPAAQGGEKIYYQEIYRLTGNQWDKIGKLPVATAYGVSATTPEGILCVGGTNGKEDFRSAYLIRHKHGNAAEICSLPDLPVALSNAAGAYSSDGYFYIAGGQSQGKTSNRAFRLRVAAPKTWEPLPSLPGKGRIQAAGVVQNGATGTLFLVIGGYSDETKKTFQNALIFDKRQGKWHLSSPIVADGKPIAVVGASAVSSGSMFVLCLGGVDREIFEAALQGKWGKDYLQHNDDWYKFRRSLLIYNTITDTWFTEDGSHRLARAGAAVSGEGTHWVITGGESKPGIRSSDSTALQIKNKTNFGTLNWCVLCAYLTGMVIMGYYFMRKENNADDFFKGGGRIPWWAAGISIYATMLSAITYMAYPAKAFATDWTYYPMLVTILLVSFPVIRYYLPFFRRLNVTSAYEYLERRFHLVLRLMASALFIIFMVARMALVLYLPSLALTAVTGIDIYVCIVLMAFITIIYCTMGGVEAVIWGDVVQGIILVGGALFAVVYLISSTEGGASGFWNIACHDGNLRLFDWSLSYKSATFWVVILGGMANNLISYTSDQTVIQRYLTTKDEKSARHSILLNGTMSVFVSIAFFAIGAGLYTFFKTHPADMDFTMNKNDIIFPFFMMSRLPAGIAGLLIAAIFAATMSTISSNINSVATAFSTDFVQRFHPTLSGRSLLRCARYASFFSGLLGMGLALLMATWNILSLLDFFQEILGLLSSGLGGLFLMGIFFPRIGAKSAFIGFLAGIAAVFLTKTQTETSFLLYGAIGIGVSVGTGWILSFVFHEPRPASELFWTNIQPKQQQ